MSRENITVHIKVETGWEVDTDITDVSDALRDLYAGHVFKEELVFGPELLQPAHAIFEQQDLVTDVEILKQAVERTCSVNLEHMIVDLKHHTCRIGGRTYKLCQNQGFIFKQKSRKKAEGSDRLTVKTKLETTRTVKKLRGAKYCCNECKYSTKHAENLLIHLNVHDGQKPFKCSECSARFSCRTYMKTHLRIHRGEKPYNCYQCTATFSQSSHLNRHLKRHLNEKPYKCSQCSSKFKDNWSLIRHEGTHSGKKSHVCSECGAAFNQTCNLLRHQRIHTGEKRYKCSFCDAAFVQSCDLAKHLKIHSGKGPLECQFCIYKTTRVATLKSHIKKWHSSQLAKAEIEVSI